MSKKIKLFFSAIFVFSFVFCDTANAQFNFDYSDILIIYTCDGYINEEEYKMQFKFFESDVPPFFLNGTTMIPLRAFVQAFEYHIAGYQAKDKKIIIRDKGGKNEWIFFVDSPVVNVNGKNATFSQTPTIRDNRIFIPLNYVSELFGKFVSGIDGESMIIWISSHQLLTEDDVDIKNDNFYLLSEEFLDYKLKSDRQTYRGIKIGDTYKKVVELYGEPHANQLNNKDFNWLIYYTTAWPSTSDVDINIFIFKDGVVDDVIIGLRH